MWEWIVYWAVTGLRHLGFGAWAWLLVGAIVWPKAKMELKKLGVL